VKNKLILTFAFCILHFALVPLNATQYQVIVYKTDYTLELYQDGKLIKIYPIALGFNPIDDKQVRGDGCTPEGEFYICLKDPNSIFYKSFLISYPNLEDAERGLAAGLITQAQYRRIKYAVQNKQIPPQDTKLGSDILIHGGGIGYNWTLGCVALKNEDILELFNLLPLGTTVIIKKSKD
jgi:murein L,D-transpeptidase YafK